MKICHVITRLILGGAQENTVLTCEGLSARGHEVTLVAGPTTGPEGEIVTRARAGGYRYIEIEPLVRPIAPRRDRLACKRLVEVLDQIRPDIMHSHSSKAGILARKAAAAVGGMKIVHTVHGLAFHRYQSWWRNRLYIALEKRAAARSDAIISVADAMTAQGLSAGVGRPEQYTTIRSGMEVELLAQRPPAADEYRRAMSLGPDDVLVTQVSRLAELKGHEHILAAAARISDRRIHFCFVGDGHWRKRIEARIAGSDLADRFHLTGLVRPEDIPTIMHATDILVHCSFREGLARALPQAMLAGRPVVSFDIDGAREIVDSQTGVLLAPGDTAGLRLSIETLADCPELRERLGAAGRQRCAEQFDHNRMVDQIEAVYRRIV